MFAISQHSESNFFSKKNFIIHLPPFRFVFRKELFSGCVSVHFYSKWAAREKIVSVENKQKNIVQVSSVLQDITVS